MLIKEPSHSFIPCERSDIVGRIGPPCAQRVSELRCEHLVLLVLFFSNKRLCRAPEGKIVPTSARLHESQEQVSTRHALFSFSSLRAPSLSIVPTIRLAVV